MQKSLGLWSYLLIGLLVLMGLSAVVPVVILSIPTAKILPMVAVTAGLFWTLPCFLAAWGVAKKNRTVLMILMVIGGLGILQILAIVFLLGGTFLTSGFGDAHLPIKGPSVIYTGVLSLWPILLFFLAYKENQRLKTLK